MSNKLPAMQWYPGDWRKDPGVQALSYEERGVWFELLMLMHDCEDRGKLMLNGKPIEHKRLAVMLRLTEAEITEHITQYITLGVASVCPDTGAVMCRRMVRDEANRMKNVINGKKGGNPAFEKGKDNPYYKRPDNPTDNPKDNRKISPSSSSSSSSSEECIVPTSGTATPRKRFTPPTPEEVRAYGQEIKFDIDAGKFCDFYASKGWKVGSTPMKDWKAAVRTWRAGQHSTPVNGKHQPKYQSSLPDFDDMLNDPYYSVPAK